MKKLVRTSSAGNALLVCKLNRLGRSMWHLVVLLEELCERGIRACSIVLAPKQYMPVPLLIKQISKVASKRYMV
ncbi:recombinase family protein [Escherichia coli]|nr:recombinase family protein [Escherichia coli]EHH6595189.1 recombinase family protein [Escherichia coli]